MVVAREPFDDGGVKAWITGADAGTLGLADRAIPSPAADEVLVRVDACRVCRTDLHVIDHELPVHRSEAVPGHQAVGTISDIGPDVQHLRSGARIHQRTGPSPACCDDPSATDRDGPDGRPRPAPRAESAAAEPGLLSAAVNHDRHRLAHAPIVTLTMNPALDVSSSVDRVRAERKLRCGRARFDPGGGGVNVSRAIRNLHGSSTPIYPLGGPTGAAYRTFAADRGIAGAVIAITGDTRESFTVDETSTGDQYRFVLPGPTLSEAEWSACLSAVTTHLPHGGYLVASGSLPPGVPEDFYAMLATATAEQDVRLVVDASGRPLQAALAEGVFLIKPSRDELAELVGTDRELTPDEQLEAARHLIDKGQTEVVALTMGSAGALLISSAGALRLPTPKVHVASPVGAGDAFLGGLVLRLAEGRPIADAFRTAVAAGSATAMMPGTELCRAEDVTRFEAELSTV